MSGSKVEKCEKYLDKKNNQKVGFEEMIAHYKNYPKYIVFLLLHYFKSELLEKKCIIK